MEGKHWHTGIEAVLFAGISAVLVINLVRFAAAAGIGSRYRPVRAISKAAGALVHFGD